MNGKSITRLKSQRGIAMMVALLALLLLAAIGMGLMFMADTENSGNNNYRDSQKAYFAARAGAEQARLLLAADANTKGKAFGLDGHMPSSVLNTGMIYLMNPTSGEAIDPTAASGNTLAANPYLDDQLCWEKYTGIVLTSGTGPCGSNNQAGQLLLTNTSFTSSTMPAPGSNAADALAFKWVRIANKQNFMGPLSQSVKSTVASGAQVCWTGSKEVPITAGTCTAQFIPMMPVWELTSLAVTPSRGNAPGSRRIVQMEVAFAPPINPPAAVAAQAPIGLQGNLQVNGYDNCSCTSTNASRPGKTCNGSHLSVFSAQGINQTGNAATLTAGVGNGLTTYDANGNVVHQGSTAANQPWPYDVNQMISDYKTSAQNASTTSPWNFSCSNSNCGTQAGATFGAYPTGLPDAPVFPPGNGPATVYVPGSVHLSGNATGSGILIIDGDLDVHGGLAFYGLILVKGQMTFTGGAHQSVTVFGAVLAGRAVNAQDIAQQA